VEGESRCRSKAERSRFWLPPKGLSRSSSHEPWAAVEKAGGRPVLAVGSDDKVVQGFNHLDKGDTFDADLPVQLRGRRGLRRLCCPVGWAQSDFLRTVPEAVAFVRGFVEGGTAGRVRFCHAPWTLVEADVVRGRRMNVLAEFLAHGDLAMRARTGSIGRSWSTTAGPGVDQQQEARRSCRAYSPRQSRKCSRR
jgi:hypothetical protein